MLTIARISDEMFVTCSRLCARAICLRSGNVGGGADARGVVALWLVTRWRVALCLVVPCTRGAVQSLTLVRRWCTLSVYEFSAGFAP